MSSEKSGYQGHIGQKLAENCDFSSFYLVSSLCAECRHFSPLSSQAKPIQIFELYNSSLGMASEKSGYQGHIGRKLAENCDFSRFYLVSSLCAEWRHFGPLSSQAKMIQLFELYNSSLGMFREKVGIRVILGKNWPKTVIFHHFTLFLGSMTQCRHFSPLSSQAKPIQLFELYNSSL